MIEVKIVADSISPANVRITTFVLTYPRFIHSEFMTHRVFSRNASSSRAIPIKRQIQEVIDNPVIPIKFTKNQKGMQGGEEVKDTEKAKELWLKARDAAVATAKELADLEIHKQYVNRILEPFAHISVVCTGTDFDNFFALRYHPDAQPEIQELAKKMWKVYSANQPEKLEDGEWHLPFVSDDETAEIEELFEQGADFYWIVRSVARCARVSYKKHDGTDSEYKEDLALYNRLMKHSPIHASPSEHQAMCVGDPNVKSGNFRGWVQYRKTIPNENIDKFNPPEEEQCHTLPEKTG